MMTTVSLVRHREGEAGEHRLRAEALVESWNWITAAHRAQNASSTSNRTANRPPAGGAQAHALRPPRVPSPTTHPTSVIVNSERGALEQPNPGVLNR